MSGTEISAIATVEQIEEISEMDLEFVSGGDGSDNVAVGDGKGKWMHH